MIYVIDGVQVRYGMEDGITRVLITHRQSLHPVAIASLVQVIGFSQFGTNNKRVIYSKYFI